MTTQRTLAMWLYLANACVLITHEIDSAYWLEWKLFGLPGGIQTFLVLNLILVFVVLLGLKQVVTWQRGAKGFSLLLAGAGLFAFSIHSFFIYKGHPEFQLPVSMGLLVASLALSLAQIAVLLRMNGADVL